MSAVEELADLRPEEMKEHLLVLDYLKGCNLLFENGTLSHQQVSQCSSKVLKNIDQGFEFFVQWKEKLSKGLYSNKKIIIILCFLNRIETERSHSNTISSLAGKHVAIMRSTI